MKAETVKKHIECFVLIKMTGASWDLCKYLEIEEIKKGCHQLIGLRIEEPIKSVSLSLQKKLIENLPFMKYVKELLLKAVPIQSVEILLEQSGGENIMEYETGLVAEVLLDSGIPRNFWLLYLRHYASMNLDEQQKRYLWKSLQNYQARTNCKEEGFIAENKMSFCTSVLAGSLLTEISEYEEVLKHLVKEKAFWNVMELLDQYACKGTRLDNENCGQLSSHVMEVKKGIQQLTAYFTAEEMSVYINLWLENHALLYDLQRTLRRIQLEGVESALGMLRGRAAYIAFLYRVDFPELYTEREKEDMLIYAISHKKKHFLSIVKEDLSLFNDIPKTSILFQREFYTRLINLNTLNRKNLNECKEMISCRAEAMEAMPGWNYTFEEVRTIIQMPIVYIKLYVSLDISRVDDRLRVIREIIKKKCLPEHVDRDSICDIAENLSIKMLSKWIEQDFCDIEGINMETGIELLKEYKRLKHLIPRVTSNAEATYLIRNADVVCMMETMEQIRENIFDLNEEWLELKSIFKLDEIFVEANKERIRKFLYEDGAHIMLTYYKGNKEKHEELRRLMVAEFMGRFQELKYHGNDLSLELDYPLADYQKNLWQKNSKLNRGNLTVWEEDGLLPVMKIGECPHHTCLSYINGNYSQCLLACFDSNKKILYLSYNRKIVLRAIIRLTKGCFEKIRRREMPVTPKLEFVDLEQQGKSIKKADERKEYLTLFLERFYASGLPGEEEENAVQLILKLISEKARALDALLVVSPAYEKKMSENGLIKMAYSVYISKSKAGEQYLDSLGGSNAASQEGNYYWNEYYILEKDRRNL